MRQADRLAISRRPQVAVLLPTYNGATFLQSQIRSLGENSTPFTLHWLDDQSSDATRETARSAAAGAGIELREWHQPERLGLAGAFFQLLDCVEADIYLFCDQDDIWQPGKIDASVADLLPDVQSPVLCFSDPLIFTSDRPEASRRLSAVTGIDASAALRSSWWFTYSPALGHTIGLTRPLRDIFLGHRNIARTHAFVHDWWLYIIAHASGTCRLLPDAPTTLYRLHGRNTFGGFIGRNSKFLGHIAARWHKYQAFRGWLSRQAEGFKLASAMLPQGAKLERMLAVAQLVAQIGERQSPLAIARLARRGGFPVNNPRALGLALTCLFNSPARAA